MAIDFATKPPIIVLHGTPGIGVTTFAGDAPSPVFINTEDGMGLVTAEAYPTAQCYDDVIDALGALYVDKSGKYKTVVLDSLSSLESLIWQSVAAKHDLSNIEDFGYGKGYVYALDLWAGVMSGIIALRDNKGIMPILIAHSEIARFEAQDHMTGDYYQPNVHKRVLPMLFARADIIGFAAPEGAFDDPAADTVSTKDGLNPVRRALHLSGTRSYIAKNRFALPDTIPFRWDEFSVVLEQVSMPHSQ